MENTYPSIQKEVKTMTSLFQRPDIIPYSDLESFSSIISQDLQPDLNDENASLRKQNQYLRTLLETAQSTYQKSLDQSILQNQTLRQNYQKLSNVYKEQKRVFTSQIFQLNQRYDLLLEQKAILAGRLQAAEQKLSAAIQEKLFYCEKLQDTKALQKGSMTQRQEKPAVLELKISQLQSQLESLHKLYVNQLEQNERLVRSSSSSQKLTEGQTEEIFYFSRKIGQMKEQELTV